MRNEQNRNHQDLYRDRYAPETNAFSTLRRRLLFDTALLLSFLEPNGRKAAQVLEQDQRFERAGRTMDFPMVSLSLYLLLSSILYERHPHIHLVGEGVRDGQDRSRHHGTILAHSKQGQR